MHPGVRANADTCVVFGQEDPLQVEAVAEHYFSKLPKPDAIKVLNDYAYKDPYSEKNYALLIDVTDRNRSKCYEQRVAQACFKETPPFLVGGPDFWSEDLEQYKQFWREAYQGMEKAGPDDYFETEQ